MYYDFYTICEIFIKYPYDKRIMSYSQAFAKMHQANSLHFVLKNKCYGSRWLWQWYLLSAMILLWVELENVGKD